MYATLSICLYYVTFFLCVCKYFFTSQLFLLLCVWSCYLVPATSDRKIPFQHWQISCEDLSIVHPQPCHRCTGHQQSQWNCWLSNNEKGELIWHIEHMMIGRIWITSIVVLVNSLQPANIWNIKGKTTVEIPQNHSTRDIPSWECGTTWTLRKFGRFLVQNWKKKLLIDVKQHRLP